MLKRMTQLLAVPVAEGVITDLFYLDYPRDSVEAVLRSQYFAELRELADKAGNHGGCTLFEVSDQVEKLLA